MFDARAEPATGAERERLWAVMAGVFPEYDRFRTRTAREIPVVRILPR